MTSLKEFTDADTEQRLNRLEDDLKIAKSRADSAEKRMHEALRLREAFNLLAEAPVQKPDWVNAKAKASDAPHVAVLVTSDFQWGESISRENMDGINEFNVGVAEKRYRRLIDATLDISFSHLLKNKYDGLVYLRLGDSVSGDIHQELRETNEMGGVEACRSLVAAEQWGLDCLVKEFKKVHVVSVPGNHGRTSLKPPSKKIAETNYDTLTAWWLESAFQKDKRFTWQSPNSTDAVFEVYGRRYLATHGDNIGSRGGQGFVGPAATILRGMKKTMDEYARRGDHLSKMFVGHFHTAYDLGYGWSNGSLPGYSEFARVNRMTPEVPVQWLLYFHPRHGVTSQWQVRLEPESAPIVASVPFK